MSDCNFLLSVQFWQPTRCICPRVHLQFSSLQTVIFLSGSGSGLKGKTSFPESDLPQTFGNVFLICYYPSQRSDILQTKRNTPSVKPSTGLLKINNITFSINAVDTYFWKRKSESELLKRPNTEARWEMSGSSQPCLRPADD